MSVEAKLKIGYNEAKEFLGLCEIEYVENTTKVLKLSATDFSSEFFSASQEKDYIKIYDIARRNHDYTILLEDHSFFQFSYSMDQNGSVVQVRYAYYELPQDVISFKDFLQEYWPECRRSSFEALELYEQVKSEAQPKASVTPIRYDYDEMKYNGIRHPASHLHVGHDNQLRFPLSMLLLPQSFAALVVRHIYRKQWLTRMDDSLFCTEYYKLRRLCPNLPNELFSAEEKNDLYVV